jgi:hypothetical protein
MRRLMRMGEEIGEDNLEKFDVLRAELETSFSRLIQKNSHSSNAISYDSSNNGPQSRSEDTTGGALQ